MEPGMHRRTCARVALAVCLTAVGCGERDDSDARFSALERAVEAERAELGAPGVAVAIVEKGEVTYAHGFGAKDLRNSAPVEATTLFRIGSTTKPLTSLAVMQAVQAGRISLDEPVTTYVPAFHLNLSPDAPANITIRHLLTHSSGLADHGDATIAPPDERTDAALESYLTGRFADLDYVGAPPGAVWAYANANYMLAGLVAEKATQTPYRTLLADSVFSPLGMARTHFLAAEVIADSDYAVGDNCIDPGNSRCFAPEIGKVIEPDTCENPWSRPDGGAWSSVLDMAEFARFLLHGQPDVLSDELLQQMSTKQISTRQAADLEGYGLGLFMLSGFGSLSGFQNVEALYHDGDVAGFSSTFRCVPSLDFCFISLSNSNGAHFEKSFSTAYETLTQPGPSATPPDLSPKPARFSQYAGTYYEPSLGEIRVAAENGRLSLEVPSLDADGTPYDTYPEPMLVDNFTVKVDGNNYNLRFVADDKDVYQYFVARPYIGSRVAN